MKKYLIIAAALLLAATACGNRKGASAKSTPEKEAAVTVQAATGINEGQRFTDFSAFLPDGSSASLSDFVGKGKYILVDFWASWCGPCKREIPNIKAAWEKYKGDNFDVLSVAVWDNPEDTAAAAAEHGVVWNQLVNAGKVPTDLYGIQGIPHLILFGPDGTILARGFRGEEIEATVAKFLQ